MQITLVQAEIETAIRQFVGNQVSIKDGMRLDIDLKATRGDVGYTCVVEIRNDNGENADAIAEREANLGIASKIEEARGEVVDETEEAVTDAEPNNAPVEEAQPDETVADEPAAEAEAVPVEEEAAPDAAEADSADEDTSDVAIDTATEKPAEPDATASEEAPAEPEAVAEEVTPKPAPKKSLFGNAKPAAPAEAA